MDKSETETIPESFLSRKRKILSDLSIPDAEYTDLSPKGSVDEGIRDLIHDINTLSGLVTTSSCAGRISVFLEGRKSVQPHSRGSSGEPKRQFAPSGGKGAGKWLFVSHEPLKEDVAGFGCNREETKLVKEPKSLCDLFGMVPGDGKPPGMNKRGQAPRLVRFHFEPMILHIMAATLHHAHPVLSAASASGFRESGLQSLRCLEADDGPSPIVAVRSAGLSMESVIGYCEENEDDDGLSITEPVIRSLVTEEYLQMLIAISNERFSINAERKERFRSSMLELCSSHTCGAKAKGKTKSSDREDPEKRRERKRAEGLMRKKLLEDQAKLHVPQDDPQACEEM
ncbi:hypothetical protein EYZ11_008411 [Aspergillus tanneri]|uniref:tRNA(Phe) 7-[(3-amino-3-carboxypropyl)-4-demethylwyosine(37)-N(4)]-methyltransferase n=1 Tax=Aspergillus tanneri TaxID=1220188 RepID=A0A4S3JAK3_9EURO|nr:uncharacterized protein ATNIH1004_010214 [Aspergillus tanneri]KAA8643445.1 hypothetical protein ATNIH1004_010214 [Aspergillus tanneri]THC92116.1 hypothetical protein EYZ11_008411 [Aspergillus tanneri]